MQTPPKIEINAQNYHTRGKGENLQVLVTHNETSVIPYISWKDISGLFMIENPNNKKYTRLHIETEVCIADEVSYADYIEKKNRIAQRNKGKDSEYSFNEWRIIDGINNKYYLVKNEPSCDIPVLMNYRLYVFFAMIGFGMLYKSIFDSKCIYKHFVIRKIVSMKYDITKEYKLMSPSLCINGKYETIEESKTSNSEKTNDEISEEEIKKAKEMYRQYIPRFNLYNDGKENWIEEYYEENNTNH